MREILIFSGGAMLVGTVRFFTICLYGGIRLKGDEKYIKENGRGGQYYA